MGLFKRGDIWWARFTPPSGKRIRCSTETSDRQQAQEFFDGLKAKSWRVDKLKERKRRTWNEASLRWLQESQHKESLDDDAHKLAWLSEQIGDTYLDELDADRIRSIVEKRQWQGKQIAPGTRNRYYALVRAIMRRAVREWKWIDHDVFLRQHKEPEGRVRSLKPEQLSKLLAELPAHLRPIVQFAVSTGLRMRNVSHLTWEAIDMDRRVATIPRTKNGKALAIPLNDYAHALLTSLQPAGGGSGPIFTFRGQLIDNPAGQTWREAVKRAGIKNFKFHDLRHTWASWLMQNGASEFQVQLAGGWQHRAMVKRYAEMNPEHLAPTVGILDGVLGTFQAHAPDVADTEVKVSA